MAEVSHDTRDYHFIVHDHPRSHVVGFASWQRSLGMGHSNPWAAADFHAHRFRQQQNSEAHSLPQTSYPLIGLDRLHGVIKKEGPDNGAFKLRLTSHAVEERRKSQSLWPT